MATRDRFAMSELLPLYPQHATYQRQCRISASFRLFVPHLRACRHGGDFVAIVKGSRTPAVAVRLPRARAAGVGQPFTASDVADMVMAGPVMSSRPGESHPQALPEPYVNLSTHTAPDVRPFP